MIAVWLLLAAAAPGQDRGAEVFKQSCAVGYCHGSGGSANRAPRLAGRTFERARLRQVVEAGLPNSAMPGFARVLSPADLSAVVEYVAGLGTATGHSTPSTASAAARIPEDAKRGKDLFFDPVRGTRCGTCHLLEGLGSAVGPNLASRPPAASAIRSVKAVHVQIAAVGGDRFPALTVENKNGWLKVYDLTVAPPVLRTLREGEVQFSAGEWSHAKAISAYTDQELARIAVYLAWLAAR